MEKPKAEPFRVFHMSMRRQIGKVYEQAYEAIVRALAQQKQKVEVTFKYHELELPRHQAGLELAHNPQRVAGLSVMEFLELNSVYDFRNDDAKARAINKNELWTMHWYPETTMGFLAVAAPTQHELLDWAMEMERMTKR